MNPPKIDDLTRRERKSIRSLEGHFWDEDYKDANYGIEHNDDRTYIFRIRSTSVGLRLLYKGAYRRGEVTDEALPKDILEQIESQPVVTIENLRDAM